MQVQPCTVHVSGCCEQIDKVNKIEKNKYEELNSKINTNALKKYESINIKKSQLSHFICSHMQEYFQVNFASELL